MLHSTSKLALQELRLYKRTVTKAFDAASNSRVYREDGLLYLPPPYPMPQAQGGMINISAFDNMELLSIIWKERNVYTLACVQE